MTIVIAGGGPVGMLAALLLKRRHVHARVVLLEKDRALGGLYRSFRYGDGLVFDCGTHLYYDTGNEEVDQTVQGLMPDVEWNILEGNRKDVAGAYFHGRLQTNSAYLDLRSQPPEVIDACLEEMRQNTSVSPPTSDDADSHLCWRFGNTITSTFVNPVLGRLYGHPAHELTTFATRLTAMDRVILFGEERMLEIMRSSKGLRARLAYPDQLRFPGPRASSQRALYPRRGGMDRFVTACTQALVAAGVEIRLEHHVSKMDVRHGTIQAVEVTSPRGTESFSAEDGKGLHVFWACGLPALAPQLGVPKPVERPEVGPRCILVHLMFEKPIHLDDVYYFYVYDPGFLTFRVTSYGNYCSDLRRAGHPITVELWSASSPADGDAEPWIRRARTELEAFGVLDPDNPPTLARVEFLKENLPRPTLRNRDALRRLRQSVASARPTNCDVIGAGSEEDLFFLHDTLADMHGKLGHMVS